MDAREISTQESIRNSVETAEYFRLRGKTRPLSTHQLTSQFRMLIEQILSESGFYAPEMAAVALKQAEGDIFEAVQYLRAQKNTIERKYESETIDTRHMFVERRISSAFREIPGGQILGPSRDYTQRLLEPHLATENMESIEEFVENTVPSEKCDLDPELTSLGKVADLLRKEGLMKGVEEDDRTLVDITRTPITFPAPRSARLQMLAKSQTGAILAIGYSGQRGFGGGHGTVGELRVGKAPVKVKDNHGRERSLGRIRTTEAEMITRMTAGRKGSLPHLAIGYGLCFGQNETKAISMGGLDRSMRKGNDEFPCQSQEFLMYHCEAEEAWGGIQSHKLPNYTAFESDLNLIRQAVARSEEKSHDVAESPTN
ncbi:MAG: carbon-phosphorus lyase complex subunit PhnI [Opitutales bacterium]|nr:carbon-phosphorus lyase complex subunit PhnI [Opitutales bacterium]